MSKTSSFDILNQDIKNYLADVSITKPTAVQSKTMQDFLDGKSLNVIAPTGTGKTLSYALPLFHNLQAEEQGQEAINSAPRAVVLLPTKELARQTFDVLKSISHFAKQRVRMILGGEESAKSSRAAAGAIDILITGPGRFLSMLKRKELKGDQVKYLIIDEADQLFDQGFFKEIEKIYNFFEWSTCKVHLLSATAPQGIEEKLSQVFRKVEFKNISIEGAHNVKVEIETFNVHLNYKEKYPMLRTFLDREKHMRGIIFVNQFEDAKRVGEKLTKDYPQKNIYILHGKLSASERSEIFEQFRANKGVMVATDIVARGIDIKNLGWVVNYDLPFDAIYYLHRAGRVGRNGNSGRVFNFVTSKDTNLVMNINQAIMGENNLKIGALTPCKKKVTKKTTKTVARTAHGKDTRKKKVRSKNNVKRTPRYKRK